MSPTILRDAVDFAFSHGIVQKHMAVRIQNGYKLLGLNTRWLRHPKYDRRMIRISFDYWKPNENENVPEDFHEWVYWNGKEFRYVGVDFELEV